MQDALAFEDVDHFVVDMAVIGCPARRNHTEELSHVAAADLFGHEIAKLAIPARRQQRLVGKPDRSRTGSGGRPVRLWRDCRDGQQILRPWVLDLVRLAGREVDARAGFELVFFAVDDHRPAAGRGVNDLLEAVEPPGERTARVVARHVQLEERGSR